MSATKILESQVDESGHSLTSESMGNASTPVQGTTSPMSAEVGHGEAEEEFIPRAKESITLSPEAFDRFVEDLMGPPRPLNKKLVEARQVAIEKGFFK